MKRTPEGLPARKRLVAAAVAGAVVATAAVSLVVAGMPMLNNFIGSSTAGKTTEAPIVISTPATPSVFPTFKKADYVQPDVPATATEAVKATTIKVGSDTTGKVMPEGLAGLSMDTDHLVDMHMDPALSNFAEILKMSGDPVIRFGAQAVDRRFFWTSTDEPIPNWEVVPAYSNDKRKVIKITPDTLKNLKNLLDQGNARVLMAVDMGHYDPARAADFAKWAHKILGNRMVGISLGNEPNGYNRVAYKYLALRPADYTFDDWATEVRAYSAAIAKTAPGVKVVGPQAYSEVWWKGYAGLDLPNEGALTFHNYPLSTCDAPANSDQARTITNALSRQLSDYSANYAASAVKAAAGHDIPVWNSETNISTCFGSNEILKTHASAMWTINFAMRSATEGVTQLNFHGGLEACKGGAPGSPLCDSGPYNKPNGTLTMRPQYYGIMMVNKLGSGDFLRSEVAGNENIYAYPVKHKDGTMGVMVVNQNDPAKQAPAKITLTLPRQAATGTMTQLAGPELNAQDQTRIDGQESSGVALAKQAKIPGFKAGEQTLTVKLNSGTASILNFTF
ncbi:hypothetical protein [Arthrobacter livingstonensis]|nr:hypothetical protein [Arthrobacter livingstonensis]